MKTTLAPSLSVLLAFASPCQDDSAAASATFVLDPGTHEAAELIDRVADFLDYNILYEAHELANVTGIRVTRRTEVDADACWDLFGSLLFHKGLAILPLRAEQGFYQVILMNGPRARELSSAAVFVPYEEVERYAHSMATPIQTTVPLRNISATVATNALRPFFAAGGGGVGLTFGNVGNNTSLLVQGLGHQVAAACRMLERVDVGEGEAERSRIQVVRAEHASAQDLARQLEAVLGARAQQTQAYAQMQGGVIAELPLRVVAHPSLNSLILVGTPTQCKDAIELVAALDRPAVPPPGEAKQLERRVAEFAARLQRLERALSSRK